MLSMSEYVHERMKTYPLKEVAVDFTMGQGFDTCFLSSLCEKVYSFDIQQEALDITASKLQKENVSLILKSHEYFDEEVTSFDIGVFNLGYLPQHDHHITTKLSSTQVALKKAIKYMNQVLFVVCYIGHEEGKREAEWINDYVSSLETHQFNVSCYKMMNKNQAPYVIEIEKRIKR